MRRTTVIAAVLAALLLPASQALASASAPAAQKRSSVVITKIWYNSPGPDHGSNASLNHEWVKLHNRTSRRVTLTGWTLRDASRHVYTFGRYRLKAGATVKVRTGRGSNTQTNLYWGRRWYIWNNTGDTAKLERPSGKVKSRCSYSDPRKRRSFKDC